MDSGIECNNSSGIECSNSGAECSSSTTKTSGGFANTLQYAERGEVAAQFKVACCYEHGYGVAKDTQLAKYWYSKAADQGDEVAKEALDKLCPGLANDTSQLFALGVNYYCGDIFTAKDYKKAVYWFTKAAKLGDMNSQLNLALCYKNAQGVERDRAKAVEWLTKAADQGLDDAIFELALAYEMGEGVARNSKKAFALYKKAAELGHGTAAYNLSICYKYGDGTSINNKKSLYWLTEAGKHGLVKAQCKLGEYYSARGRNNNIANAKYWYKKAAEQGDEDAIEAHKRLQ